MHSKITIDTNGLFAAFHRVPTIAARELRVEVKKRLVDVQRRARQQHKYTTRSGDLERSVSDPIVSRSGLSGSVELNPTVAVYGRRIHDGGGGKLDSRGRRMTNKPDPFLENALEAEQRNIERGIESAVKRIIDKSGL